MLSVYVCKEARMAATNISVEEDQFCCPVCLEVLKDPVTTPCGHSYCMDCIKSYWDKSDLKGVYSCPQCRESFSPRPVLGRNNILAEVVEKLRKAGVQASRISQTYANVLEDVECDICTKRKSKAVRTCLVCLASYCESHLKVHQESKRGGSHKVVEAIKQPHRRLCSQHRKPLEVFCHTDQRCICFQCKAEGHKGHNVVSANSEREVRQKQLKDAGRRSRQMNREREKEIRHVVKYIKQSSEAAGEDSERIFSKLARTIERKRLEVRQLIKTQEREAVARAETILQALDEHMTELNIRDCHLDRLSQTDDHIHFLQRCRSLEGIPDVGDLPSLDIHPYFSLIAMKKSLTELQERLDDVFKRELSTISDIIHKEERTLPLSTSKPQTLRRGKSVEDMTMQHTNPPRTRAELLQYGCEVTLDLNTANSFLSLREGLREVMTGREPLKYPDHPERFTCWAQLLCRHGLCGRCYWEVEWKGGGGVSIGVAYKSIRRNVGSADGKLGHNNRSWSLDFLVSGCYFQHNKTRVDIPVPHSTKVGVYVDHRAGTLAFYSISDTLTLLHSVQTTFTQPLYPGFWVGLGSTLKICPFFNFAT
ncbi:E3 ubiquitin/ISG15 ligase TRIM25 [Clupea harengus]|uniref:E3 ubiquitin/ISG15 ligase TRIM25 n=1 Tax=Clupea harengus TaxID=7950 RepID=A0A6P8ESQ4_CLUHA|nr:E3 ubiquitin/ISG15 ligase TRIM25 [Clupea harengus]